MSFGKFQGVHIKREVLPGITVRPTKAIKIEDSSLNTKVNMQSIAQIDGKVFSPDLLLKNNIETMGTINFFADRENLLYFLNMFSETPSATNNGDGTYTYVFDLENAYGLPSYTIDIIKDRHVMRGNGIVANSLSLSVSDAALKGAVELVGLKSGYSIKLLASAANTLTVSTQDVALFVSGDEIVFAGTSSDSAPTMATVASVNPTTGVITVGTGEGTAFASQVGKGITFKRQALSFTSGLKPMRWYSNASVTIGGSDTKIMNPTFDLKNETEAKFYNGSDFASVIDQKLRTFELGFEMDSKFADNLLFAYNNSEEITFSITFTGEDIGTGTAVSTFNVAGTMQIKEAPVDIKVSDYITIPFKADVISVSNCSVKTTVSSL